MLELVSSLGNLVLLDDFGPGLVVVLESFKEGLVQEGGVNDSCTHNVGVDVGCWSSVLDVTSATIGFGLGGDSDRGSSVACSVGENVWR